MRAVILAALAACGDSAPPNITVIDSNQQLAFQVQSNTVVLERTFAKDMPISLQLEVIGNADAFPGPDQVPLAGDLFVSVENPAALGDGALGGELPDHQRYQLSQEFLPARVAYAWYAPEMPCSAGCTRRSTLSMTLADNILGGIAPDTATVQLAFTATLTGWVVSADSPVTAMPVIQLAVQ